MTRIAAHRGGTLEYGDSTPQGFAATAAMKLEEVEFDLHPTADGAIFVNHDATLDRTTDRQGAIAALTEAEIRAARINYAAGAHPVSLSELCAIFRDSHVDFRCEIKPGEDGRPYADFVPRVIATLKAEGMLHRTIFTSFLLETVDELSAATDRPLLWVVSPPVLHQLGAAAVIGLAKAHAASAISLHVDAVDTAVMARVQEAGLDFGCWGAHDARQIDRALDLGVKVFTTDRPSLALARRTALKAEQGK